MEKTATVLTGQRIALNAIAALILVLPAPVVLAAGGANSEALPAAIKVIQDKGATITGTFDAPGGLRGYAAHIQGRGMALYLTPDGQHVLVGTLVDAKGNDLSEAPLEKLVYAPQSKVQWAQLEKSAWIADGRKNAPRVVYVFSDPNCPYCNKFWQQARPWVDAGKVQLRHVVVGILGPDSEAKAAALLAAQDPAAALLAHESSPKAGKIKPLASIPADIQKKLEGNLALMESMGARATPTVLYLDKGGLLQQQQGVPQGEDLEAVLGPQ